MGAGAANVYALLFLIPVLLIFGLPYVLVWSGEISFDGLGEWLDAEERTANTGLGVLYGMAVLLGGIIMHELIHGFTWALFSKNGMKEIKFGIIWKYLTPYCHCKSPLTAWQYRLGTIMPAVVLGFIPSIIANITGNTGLLFFGLFFSFAAGGDFLIIWLLRKENKETLVQDHPQKIGCVVYNP